MISKKRIFYSKIAVRLGPVEKPPTPLHGVHTVGMQTMFNLTQHFGWPTPGDEPVDNPFAYIKQHAKDLYYGTG